MFYSKKLKKIKKIKHCFFPEKMVFQKVYTKADIVAEALRIEKKILIKT